MTRHLSAQVKRLREEQRMPLTALADKLTELGTPIARLGLLRLEKGERKVDVDELAALAKALGVPPLLLILPVGSEPETEILPGRVAETWRAATWFTGETPLSVEPEYDEQGVFTGFTQSTQDFNDWVLGARPLEMFREHERLLMNWRMELIHATGDMAAVAEAQPGSVTSLSAIADQSIKQARALEKALLDHRRAMAARGFVLPRVPELDPEQRHRLAAYGLPQPSPDTGMEDHMRRAMNPDMQPRQPITFTSEETDHGEEG